MESRNVISVRGCIWTVKESAELSGDEFRMIDITFPLARGSDSRNKQLERAWRVVPLRA